MSGWTWFWGLLVVAVLVALLVWVLVRLSGRQAPTSDRTQPGALQILEERFTRGEIDQDEFENRRAVLRDSGTSSDR
ncbi:MAG: SHOCT domain-containing protein [Intrasporangiaceae bacterium]|nr:SHOCT domain-containing protein [Intrasporangiaceae bacterium]